MAKLSKKAANEMRAEYETAVAALERLQEAMQGHWDDGSAKWQESDEGEEWGAALEAVERAIDTVNEAADQIN